MRLSIVAFVGLSLGLGAVPAHAQNAAEAFLHDTSHDNAIRVSAEMDPALALGVGYLRAVDLDVGGFHRRVGVHVDATTIIGFSSWDLSSGASMFLKERSGLNVLATTDLELKLAQNEVHTAVVYGYAASLRPGYFGGVGFVAADLGLHGTIGTTLRHTDAYRAVFPDVGDGTYASTNLSFFVGGVAGVQISSRVVLGLRVAWRTPGTFENYAPYVQPYTANLEISTRF